MKEYKNPTMSISMFMTENLITTSGNGIVDKTKEKSGGNYQEVDATTIFTI